MKGHEGPWIEGCQRLEIRKFIRGPNPLLLYFFTVSATTPFR
jgi:hypothetical protein